MIVAVVLLGVLVLTLGLAILGTMREVVFLRSEIVAFSQLVMTPPEPSWLSSGYLPETLSRTHGNLALGESDEIVLLFVESSCPTCRALVADLNQRNVSPEVTDRVVFVVVDAMTSPEFRPCIVDEIRRTACRFLLDEDNELLAAAGVHGTPTALALTRTRALDYKAGVDSRWILKRTTTTAA